MGKERVRCEVERKEKCDGWRCQIRAALAASAASGDSLAVNTRLLAIIANDEYYAAFTDAADVVKRKCGVVASSLRLGSLNCSECRRAIDRCGGFDPWTRELTPEQVQVVVRDWKHLVRAEWQGQVGVDWAEASAFEFLRVCAEHGLGVRFSR